MGLHRAFTVDPFTATQPPRPASALSPPSTTTTHTTASFHTPPTHIGLGQRVKHHAGHRKVAHVAAGGRVQHVHPHYWVSQQVVGLEEGRGGEGGVLRGMRGGKLCSIRVRPT